MSEEDAMRHSEALMPADGHDRKFSSDEEEAKRIAEMGKPVLGEFAKMEVIIEESYEFKNTVDKLIKKTNLALVVGTNSWREQFMEAITVSADEDEEESGEERLPSCFDYVMHFLTVFWKVLFACVPPTDYLQGWACFCTSIAIIGMLTAVIGDLAPTSAAPSASRTPSPPWCSWRSEPPSPTPSPAKWRRCRTPTPTPPSAT
ncbi:unnamed protein product [Gadus morhua 'NCC']